MTPMRLERGWRHGRQRERSEANSFRGDTQGLSLGKPYTRSKLCLHGVAFVALWVVQTVGCGVIVEGVHLFPSQYHPTVAAIKELL